MQELTSCFILSSISLVNSGKASINLYFFLRTILTLSRGEYQDTSLIGCLLFFSKLVPSSVCASSVIVSLFILFASPFRALFTVNKNHHYHHLLLLLELYRSVPSLSLSLLMLWIMAVRRPRVGQGAGSEDQLVSPLPLPSAQWLVDIRS